MAGSRTSSPRRGLPIVADGCGSTAPPCPLRSLAHRPSIRKDHPMYFDFVADPGMNYTLNRALADGEAKDRLEEARAIAPGLTDFDAWYTAWLDLAKKAAREHRWIDAAHYYHQAEFYLPAGELRNGLYDDFTRVFAKGMEGV